MINILRRGVCEADCLGAAGFGLRTMVGIAGRSLCSLNSSISCSLVTLQASLVERSCTLRLVARRVLADTRRVSTLRKDVSR